MRQFRMGVRSECARIENAMRTPDQGGEVHAAEENEGDPVPEGASGAEEHRHQRAVPAQAAAPNPGVSAPVDTGAPHLILDGIVIPADRCGEKTTSASGEQIDLWYSGKARHHGGNIQGVLEPDGFPLFLGDVEPGSVHDLTAARLHVLGALYAAAPSLSD